MLTALLGMSLVVPCGNLVAAVGLAGAQSNDPKAA